MYQTIVKRMQKTTSKYKHNNKMTTISVRSRALGCLYGQAIGDALGTRYEFMTRDKCHSKTAKDMKGRDRLPILGGGPFSMAPGQTTDDTALAMALMRSILTQRSFDPNHVAQQYVRWFGCNPPDVGVTTTNAFRVGGEGATDDVVRANAQANNLQSRANGSMMRQSPLGIVGGVGKCDLQHVVAYTRADCLLSHPNEHVIGACQTYTRAIAMLIKGDMSHEQVFHDSVEFCGGKSKLMQTHLISAKTKCTPVMLEDGTVIQGDTNCMGYVGLALQIAFHQLLHVTSFEEGLMAAIRIGGDTDTNGAITGALLGARFGCESIPQELRDSVRQANSPFYSTFPDARLNDIDNVIDQVMALPQLHM